MAASVRRNPNKIKQGSVAVDIVLYALALFICLITLYPFYLVVIMSISSPTEVAAMNVFWYPKGFFLDSYKLIVSDTKNVVGILQYAHLRGRRDVVELPYGCFRRIPANGTHA
ncbi:hypothetical protein VQ056_03240 [Paenibacillus sp. JTLBN-2024]